MPYCQHCGRPLSENEVCGCTPQTAPQNSGMPTPAAYNYQNIQNQQAYAQNQNPNAPKKNSSTAIIIIIVVIAVLMFFVLPVIGILAAILVPAMIGYTAKSQQASVNSAAKSIYDAYTTAIIELDSKDVDTRGDYIISSDADDCINVPFDVSYIYDMANDYYTELGEYNYFVVVENGKVSYAACEESGEDRIGTYPYATRVNEGPTTYSGSVGAEGWDLEDLYYYTCKEISLRP